MSQSGFTDLKLEYKILLIKPDGRCEAEKRALQMLKHVPRRILMYLASKVSKLSYILNFNNSNSFNFSKCSNIF